jgi:hypothetical protein
VYKSTVCQDWEWHSPLLPAVPKHCYNLPVLYADCAFVDKMSAKMLSIQLLLLLAIHHVAAQYSPVSVGPLLTCDLTTFSCPGVSGCCTIAGCCGSGCCALGYTCINEGTSAQACCSVNDPTLCGTKTTVSGSLLLSTSHLAVPGYGALTTTLQTPTSESGSGSGSGSSSHTCTGIDNCPRDPVRGLAWTCVLGQTCGFSYGDCNPCPYIGSSGSTGSNDDSSSSSGTASSSPGSSSGSSSSGDGSSSSQGPKTSPGYQESVHGRMPSWLSLVVVLVLFCF